MKFEKIDTKTLRQKVYDQLRHKIISGEILPGESISLRALAKNFGVSTVPVREALFQLESEKVIIIESNKNIHVNTLTAKEMEEALRIRLMLETLVAQRSCERRPESALPKVKRLLECLKASVENPKKYMINNSQFHFAIYSYSDSPMLLHIIDWLWARVAPYFVIYVTNEDVLSKTINVHQEMYEAFASKDKKRIKDAIHRDLKDAARVIIPILNRAT